MSARLTSKRARFAHRIRVKRGHDAKFRALIEQVERALIPNLQQVPGETLKQFGERVGAIVDDYLMTMRYTQPVYSDIQCRVEGDVVFVDFRVAEYSYPCHEVKP